MPKGQELYIGQRIGKLTLIMRKPTKKSGPYNERKKWQVFCECGSRFLVNEYYLIRPNPKSSCGCDVSTFASRHKPERNVWTMMHTRCEDPKHIGYPYYGGRGIKVCERWHKTNPKGFENFVEDMGRRPMDGKVFMTLDRIDPDGNYEKYKTDGVTLQCKWATWKEQNNNKRMHKLPTYKPPGV